MRPVAMFIRVVLCHSAILASVAAQAAPVPMEAGEYEVTATVVSSGETGKPDKATRCIKADDLANPEAVFNNRFMANFKPDATCVVSGLSMAGGKVGYSTVCKYSDVRVDGTYTATSYNIVRDARPKGAGPQVNTRLAGRRLGACK
ncbi:MAG: DUF3617 family protein [Usitatibacter sp.]